MINKKAIKKNMLFLVISVFIIILSFFATYLFQNEKLLLEEKELEESGELNTNKIIISEIMSSNKGAYSDIEGNCFDWIEIYNGKDHEINLKNYALSDNNKSVKWVFPDTYIDAKSYIVVNLAGLNRDGLYANFKLKSSGGEDVILVNAAGKVIDAVTTIALNKNEVMFRDNNGKWQRGLELTPGFANTKAGLVAYHNSLEELNNDLIITEILPRNKGNFLTKANDYSGFVEITNMSKERINLSEYTLGNSLNNPFAYKLPNITLAAGESFAVFTSGKNLEINSEYHANFKLNSENGVAVLAKSGKIVNKIEYEQLANGIALVYLNEKYEKTGIVSPGYSNNDKGINEFSNKYLERPKTLIINEVMNYNQTYLPHNGSRYYDWIELYNNSNEDINLNEYYLTTNTDNMTKYQLPKVTLKKGEYYIVMASGDPDLTTTKYRHANFKIAETESLYLTKNNKIVDSMFITGIPNNYSFGRGNYGFYYYATATPYAENGTGKREISYFPLSSVKSGIYNDVKTLEVNLSAQGTIYYTLDGSRPTTNSRVYNGPISLNKTTVLKTMSLENNKYKSETQTYTYIINENHSLDVFMVSMEPEDFKNLQANRYVRGVNKVAFAELYEQDGDSFQVPCEIKMFGGNARAYGVANGYALKFKHKTGSGKLNYQVFENRDYSSFDTLLLRSGTTQPRNGPSTTPEIFRDILATSLLDGQTSVLVQAYHPVVLYINGNYYGLYNIRERSDRFFIQNNQNVIATNDNTNIVKIDWEVRSGTSKTLLSLINYLNSHNMTLKTNYDYVKTLVNVQDIADFWIAETWVANYDIVNTRYYQNANFDGNRWHMIFFDLDNAIYNVDFNYYTFSTNPSGMKGAYSTTILRTLLKNSEFRTLYLERLHYQLKNVWNEERVINQIDYLYKIYKPEVERHYKRYGFSPSMFETEIKYLKNYAKNRKKYMISQAKSFFKMTNAEVERYFGDL